MWKHVTQAVVLLSISFSVQGQLSQAATLRSNENRALETSDDYGGKSGKRSKSAKNSLGAVFTMTNSLELPGNAVVIYERAMDGTLSRIGTATTGGLGGIAASKASGALEPPVVEDPLGSQGSIILSEKKKCLIAVNAGSNTFTVFKIKKGLFLERVGVLDSHGSFPVSIAQSNGLLYVLNAGGQGSISGYKFKEKNCKAKHIPDAGTTLGNHLTDPPFFVASPAQVSFDPSGHFLFVTNKGENEILTYPVAKNGKLGSRQETTAPGSIPFGFDFDDCGNLFVVEAFGSSAIGTLNAGAVSSYNVANDGTLTIASESVSNHQTAACWLKHADGFVFTTNNLASTLSVYEAFEDGRLSLIDPEAASTTHGELVEPLDFDLTDDGEFLYVLNAHNTGNSTTPVAVTISSFAQSKGVLTFIGETDAHDVVTQGSLTEGPAGLAVY